MLCSLVWRLICSETIEHECILQVPSPLDVAGRDVTLEFSTATGSEEYASAQTLKHWDSSLSGASYRTAPDALTASNSLTRLPTPRGQAISESRERWSGARDDLINASAYPRPANPGAGARFPSPPPGQQLQRLPSPQRNSGRGLSGGTIPAPYLDASGANANLPARYANLRTNGSSRRGSARMTPPASPYANPSDPRSPHGRGADPMSTGNLSGPLSGPAMSGRGLFPAYDGMLSAHMQSGENPSKSIDMMPGTISDHFVSYMHIPATVGDISACMAARSARVCSASCQHDKECMFVLIVWEEGCCYLFFLRSSSDVSFEQAL